MKAAFSSLIRSLMITTVCTACFATTKYVVTNDDNGNDNSATVYSLNTDTGKLTLLKVLRTAGQGNGSTFNGYTVAVEGNAKCLFVMDTRSDDIASFSKATGYSKVGNYSNQLVSSKIFGGSIAVTPNGKWLYASYADSQNVGAWQVNVDCSLRFIAAYVPSLGADYFFTLGISPNGLGLVIPSGNHQAAEVFRINPNGTLSDVNFVSWKSDPFCLQQGCYPLGVDFTKDSRVVVFGDSAQPLLTASLTSGGLSNPQVWPIITPPFTSPMLVILGADAYDGSGHIFAASFGGQVPGEEPQVATVAFTEKPLNLSVVNTSTIESPNLLDAQIAVTGDTLVIAELFGTLGAYRINPDGSLTFLNSVFDANAGSLDSFSIYPNTR